MSRRVLVIVDRIYRVVIVVHVHQVFGIFHHVNDVNVMVMRIFVNQIQVFVLIVEIQQGVIIVKNVQMDIMEMQD
jgi:hypothetical protein